VAMIPESWAECMIEGSRMTRYGIVLFALLAAANAIGCSTCPLGTGCRCFEAAEKGPKTLLEWAICKEEKPEGGESGQENDRGDHGHRGLPKPGKDEQSPKAENGATETGEPKGGGRTRGESEDDDSIKTDRPDFTESS